MTAHTAITASVGDISLRLRYHSQSDKGWQFYVIDSFSGTLRFPEYRTISRLAKQYGRVKTKKTNLGERRLGDMCGVMLPSGMEKAARAAFLGAMASVCTRGVLKPAGHADMPVTEYFSVDRFLSIGIAHHVAVRAYGVARDLAHEASEDSGAPVTSMREFLAHYAPKERIRKVNMGKKTIYAINALLHAGKLTPLNLEP